MYNPFLNKKKQLASTTNLKGGDMKVLMAASEEVKQSTHRIGSTIFNKRRDLVSAKQRSVQRPMTTTGAGQILADMRRFVSKSLEKESR